MLHHFHDSIQWLSSRWRSLWSTPQHHPQLQGRLSDGFTTLDVMGSPRDVFHFFDEYQSMLWPGWEEQSLPRQLLDLYISHGCVRITVRGESFFGRDPWNDAMLHACEQTGCHLTFSQIAPLFEAEWARRVKGLPPKTFGSHPALGSNWE